MKMMLVFVLCLCLCLSSAHSQPTNQVPALFIFGDSLVDNGNNNGILTLARANYMPYGIDFPQGTTGRFTNGRTFVDILGDATATIIFLTLEQILKSSLIHVYTLVNL